MYDLAESLHEHISTFWAAAYTFHFLIWTLIFYTCCALGLLSKLGCRMGRQPCCEKSGLKRGPWTIEEDHKLMNFILNNGIQCWRVVPKLAGLLRCGKSCRLRWINYLRPDLKRGALTEAEEYMIIQLHSHLGGPRLLHIFLAGQIMKSRITGIPESRRS